VRIQKVYPRSFSSKNGLTYLLIRTSEGKRLAVSGPKRAVLADPFKGECHHGASSLKLCDLSDENTDCLMSLFPFTKPVSLGQFPITFGAGDRLGLATPGHIRAIRKFEVRPVLAQQSVRENSRTGRNFKGMIRDAAWAVFQENYTDGYGADGDHLKSLDEVKAALDAGVSMITLDLSQKLDLEAFRVSEEEVKRRFRAEIDSEDARVLFHFFLDKQFAFPAPEGGFSVRFDEAVLKRNALLFRKAVDFTEEVYEAIRKTAGGPLDFEISIDETDFPTSPENHLFFVIELKYRGVHIDALAPRFVGEFQKGIDYRGDPGEFRKHLDQHVRIAAERGSYKISVHSGSDKFSIFPEIGRLARNGFHLKTAGTSWLEAMRLVALFSPPLYREMHRLALSSFGEASRIYHVAADVERIPRLENLQDRDLPSFLDQDDSRQLLHITYGFLLDPKNGMRDRLFDLLCGHEEDYWSLLEHHMEKHLISLGVKKNPSSSPLC
jgi:hypothetical protein